MRRLGTELIQQASLLLHLPQVCSSTAQVLFQRVVFCVSLKSHSVLQMASASLFLSTKLEECPRRTRDILNVFHVLMTRLKTGDSNVATLDYEGIEFLALKELVFKGEIHILDSLGFNVHVQHPHGYVVNYLQVLGLTAPTPSMKEAPLQRAWNYVNDCSRTPAVVLFQANVLATAAIFLACRDLGIPLSTKSQWWQVFDTQWPQIQIIAAILQSCLYSDAFDFHSVASSDLVS